MQDLITLELCIVLSRARQIITFKLIFESLCFLSFTALFGSHYDADELFITSKISVLMDILFRAYQPNELDLVLLMY